jgi:RNA polymerase sigma-70 factor (ECF subfamily)
MRASQFEEIAEKYAGFVYNVALRVVGNPQDAEEVAQDAFISAWKARDRFRGDAQPSTWLYRITVNAALMKLRKDKRRKQMSAPEEEQADVPSQDWTQSPSASAINSELGERLKAAIADLPEDMRVAVVLRDVQGLSNEEAADALGVSVPAVKARLHRGRVALRDRLAGYAAEIAKG